MATVALYAFYAVAAYAAYTTYKTGQMQTGQDQEGPRLSDVKAAGSSFGVPLGDVFGATRVEGNIIWADNIIEVAKTREVHVDGPNNDYDLREYFYFVSFAVQLRRGEIFGIRKIWANNKLVYSQAEDADGTTLAASNKFADYMTVYKGTETQMPDPTIVAKEGIARTPAFRGTSYVVFEQLPLADYMNNFPRLSFEVVSAGTLGGTQITRVSVDLSTILQKLAARAGVNPLRVDTSGVSELVRGVNVGGTKYFEAAAPLLAGYNIDAFQSGYKLRFRRIADADVIDVDPADLGRDGKGAIKVKRGRESDLPRSKTITYYDYDRDYLTGTQDARRATGRARDDDEIQTTMSLTATEAKQMAEVALYSDWLTRLQYEVKLPPRYLGVEPGDVLRINNPNRGLLAIRVQQLTVGADLSLEVAGVSWLGSVLESNAVGDGGQPTDGSISLAGDTTLRLLDIAGISDNIALSPHFLVAGSGPAPWRSATLCRSVDNRSTYQSVMQIPQYSSQGRSLTTLPNGIHTTWDKVSTVDIELERGTPQSAGDAAVLAGANLVLIGDELLQFATATLIGTNQWRLSRLLRARRGTEWAKGLHGVNERVVLINTVYLLQLAIADIGAQRWWRAPSQDQALADSPEISTTYQGLALKPYSPVSVRGTRNGGGDLAVTWIRRSRVNTRPPTGEIPLGEASERYEVEIMNGATSVRRTYVTSPAWTYTAAMQIADFGSAQAAVTLNIFQLSEAVGRGFAATATL